MFTQAHNCEMAYRIWISRDKQKQHCQVSIKKTAC